MVEEFIAFDRELSQIAVRGRSGDVAFYPLVENHHEHGILRWSLPRDRTTKPLTSRSCAFRGTVARTLSVPGTSSALEAGSGGIGIDYLCIEHPSSNLTL